MLLNLVDLVFIVFHQCLPKFFFPRKHKVRESVRVLAKSWPYVGKERVEIAAQRLRTRFRDIVQMMEALNQGEVPPSSLEERRWDPELIFFFSSPSLVADRRASIIS